MTAVVKFLGSVSGSVLALVWLPPKTRSEFVRRAVLSLVCGFIFGDVLRIQLHWPDTWQMDLAASAASAMLAWFVMGAVVRVIGSWKQK